MGKEITSFVPKEDASDSNNALEDTTSRPEASELSGFSKALVATESMRLPKVDLRQETDNDLTEQPGSKDVAEMRDGVLLLDGSKNADQKLAQYSTDEKAKKELTLVVLSDSNVSEKGLAKLTEFPNLSNVQLGGLQIKPEMIDQLKRLKNLEQLYLTTTKIDAESLAKLQDLSNLRLLSLTGASISDKEFANFKAPPKLDHLSLAYTKITDEGLAKLPILAPTIQRLDLSGLNLSDTGLLPLKAYPNIEYLALTRSNIAGKPATALKELSLRQLDLTEARLTDDDVKELAQIPNLRRLSLERTAITDAALAHVGNLHSLELLNLERTAVSPMAYYTLRDTLKSCAIGHDFRDINKEEYSKQEVIRLAKQATLEKRGLKFSNYGIAEVYGINLPTIPPPTAELSVIENILDRDVMSVPATGIPLAFNFINRSMALRGGYNFSHNDIILSKDLSTNMYDGRTPYLGPNHGTLESVLLHELAHKFQKEHPWLFGEKAGTKLKYISQNRLKLIEEKLGFKWTNGEWILQGKDNKDGSKTWYKHGGELSGWVRCDETGKRFGSENITRSEMQHLSKIKFPTNYFPEPDDLMAEATVAIWLGGEARERLAAECPEVYELAMADDRDLIRSIKPAPLGQKYVRGFDGRLVLDDNPMYRKQMIEFDKRVKSGAKK